MYSLFSFRNIAFAVLGVFLLVSLYSSFYTVQPGNRGILVTLGKVDMNFKSEGLGFKMPFITDLTEVTTKQRTEGLQAAAFSSDLQTVDVHIKVLYRVPESSITTVFQQYAGNPFDSLIAPRVQEALKEVAAQESAEGIVKKREVIKTRTLELARQKVGTILVLEDIVIENIDLSKELETAIEAKMVQEQEAAKAKFTQQKAEIEAKTAVIRAEGEAKAIQVRGEAIRKNPSVIDLQIAEKWDGVAPLVVGGNGANILLPINKTKNNTNND